VPNILWMIVIGIYLASVGTGLAQDGESIYKARCALCHGAKGQGIKGMGPSFKGNEFIINSKGGGDIKKVILEGRSGAAKRYKEFPAPMPPIPITGAKAEAVVKFIQGELQK